MNPRALIATVFVVLVVCANCRQVQAPAVQFRTPLRAVPAVNAAGEVTGGLKWTKGNDACKFAIKGSQVYGRAGCYKDLWAILYAWYFPKGFWMDFPTRRHDWKNVVVWIDNLDLETPKIVGVSMSKSDTRYNKETKIWPSNFAGYGIVGTRFNRTTVYGSNTSPRFDALPSSSFPFLKLAEWDGEYQDLIMWEQLTDAARAALNDSANFGNAEVPFSDEHYEDHLEKAWPL
ncbi:hypothetical protein F441_04355 [Phytophthora nicotianae CJ01A1]|uniref:Necrosis inducing protein NPP1 n=2 Tax=Phytophthora nicotianae TaxID=4792 RepID=W2XHG3_PHYNI|nr:hypothetical protein F441_04355 [Phytophthora nicotianae CJ01A1]